MLPLQNGNEYRHQSTSFDIQDQNQIGEVRRFALNLCSILCFDDVRQGRVSIVVNELGANLVKYATGGKIILRFSEAFEVFGIEMLSIDSGPGIANVAEAMVDGFTTGSSPGTGLGSIQRQADEFDIYSSRNQGTVVYAAIYANPVRGAHRYSVGAVSVPIKGEVLCGDAWCVSQSEDRVSVLLADGLGHGPLAHAAAVAAVADFRNNEHQATLVALKSIHAALRGSRGAAVMLASCQKDSNLENVGLGNVRAVIQSMDGIKTLISQNGTAGVAIPILKSFSQTWNGAGFLILHSDGINSRWDVSKYSGLFNSHPAVIAAVIYRDFSRHNDDATVVVIGQKK